MKLQRLAGAARFIFCVTVAWSIAAGAAQAATINNLYNTGVNNFAVAIGPNLPDPHYSLIVQPGSTTATTIDDTFFPFPIWVANNAGSRWIGPSAPFAIGPAGNYVYRTTFTVPANANLSTVNVSGLWGTDDPSVDILINGSSTGNVSAGFTTLVPFNVTSGFVLGANTLDFSLNNVFTATGLRVDKIVGTYLVVPEPATICLGAGALLIATTVLRRKRRQSISPFPPKPSFEVENSTEGRSLMSQHRQFVSFGVALATALLATYLATNATADPLPGRDLLKFSQLPMINTTVPDASGAPGVYFGHDELSTAYGFSNAATPPTNYQGRFMADDFADRLSSSVVHVKWWGSYLNDIINPNMPVNKFLISFESDVPGPVPGFSHPGTPLLNQVISRGPLAPASGTFTEKLIRGPDPLLGESLYEYNAELNLGKDFPEQKDTVYWIKIAAMVDVTNGITFPPNQPPTFVTRWGWHNRDYTIKDTLASTVVVPGENLQGPINGTPIWHFQDDAVTGGVNINTNGPGGLLSPVVNQPPAQMQPTNYINGIDGPVSTVAGALSIGNFSKDLAFQIFTVQVPEPGTCMLMVIGLTGVAAIRRRSRAA